MGKMIKLILVRHGESVANQKRIYQGQTYNTGLTFYGKKQAGLLAQGLAVFKYKTIFTSPLKRTLETAKIIAGTKDIIIKTDERLIEISHGKWEGRGKKEVVEVYSKLWRFWKERPGFVQMPGGENCYQVADRIMKFLVDLVHDYKNKTVLVVGHDLVLRIIIALILGLPFNNIWKFRLDNGGITLVKISDNLEGEIVFLNKNDHLKDFLVEVDKQAL